MFEELRRSFAEPVEPDWSDQAVVVDHLVAGERRLSAPEYFDEEHIRQLAERIVDRSIDPAASLTNPSLIDAGEPVRPRLAGVSAPTLVIHGTADPLFPYPHAEALARESPQAELLPLPGVGHQMPPRAV